MSTGLEHLRAADLWLALVAALFEQWILGSVYFQFEKQFHAKPNFKFLEFA